MVGVYYKHQKNCDSSLPLGALLPNLYLIFLDTSSFHVIQCCWECNTQACLSAKISSLASWTENLVAVLQALLISGDKESHRQHYSSPNLQWKAV